MEQTYVLFIFFITLYWGWIVSVTFGVKYLTGMVTSVLPYETFGLIKKNILRKSKIYKNHIKNLNFWGMWPLGHVGHVTYSFINMLFISTGIFDDKLCPQILLVGPSANSPLTNKLLSILNNYFCPKGVWLRQVSLN